MGKGQWSCALLVLCLRNEFTTCDLLEYPVGDPLQMNGRALPLECDTNS